MLRVPGDVMMWRVSPYPLACLVSKWLRGITTQVTLISAQRFLLRQNVHLRPRGSPEAMPLQAQSPQMALLSGERMSTFGLLQQSVSVWPST